MRKIIILIALSIFTIELGAQQDAMFSQFFSNKLVVNPAYAGSRDAISITGLYRNQWTSFEGAPKTQTLTAHAPLSKINSGIGATIVYDKLGIQRNFLASLSYSYKINTGAGFLSFGLNGQIRRNQILWSESNPLSSNDNNIPYGNDVITQPNFAFGLYFYNKNYYVGLSAPDILENDFDFNTTILSKQKRHYFLMGGVVIPLNKTFKLKPALLVKYQPESPIQFDINTMLIVKDLIWLGGTYRTGDSFSTIIQFHLNNQMRIGYAYDYTLSPLNNVNNGSHEIMVGYDIFRNKGVYHPRYF